MSRTDEFHRPVMADEAIDYLNISADGNYIDATAGGGGYSVLIAERLGLSGHLLAIDRDRDAVEETSKRIREYSARVDVRKGTFADMTALAASVGMPAANGIVFDLGVSGRHLDCAGRGFSYRLDGPLDCRMDLDSRMTGDEVVNNYSADELSRILFEYGEERNARRIALAIVDRRKKEKIQTTGQLAQIIASIANPRYLNKTCSRCFQAIRLEVNDELNQLREGLLNARHLLTRPGRLVVLSYHSLEDRIVKNFMRDATRSESMITSGKENGKRGPAARLITRKPVMARAEEIARNSRARSARLRVLEKI